MRIWVILLLAVLVLQPAKAAVKGSVQAGARYEGIPDTYQLIAQNNLFQLYANKASLAFKVVDMRNGYVWDSNLDEKAETDRLNKTWVAFAESGISLDYLDQQAISKRLSITNSQNTIDFKLIDQGFQASVQFDEASIGLTVTVKLEPAGVSVEIPFDSIQQAGDFKLGTLYIYPFFGYARADSIPGYLFIPDGCGSIIDFAATTKANNMFYGKYYGTDLGMITSVSWDPTINRAHNISLPVYGMAHGIDQNAYITILEKGAPYGEIQAHPSGVITNFNFIFNAFTYNESYFQKTNRSGDGVTILQHEPNHFDILQHYRFLTAGDSDYVGMAKSYQQYLVEKGTLHKAVDTSSDIGIKLEFLGGDWQRVLVWNKFIPMTTISQISTILQDLKVKSPMVVYYGWQPLGAARMPPASLEIEKKLGNLEELKALAKQVTAEGGKFYLYTDPQIAIVGLPGYSKRTDLAMSITNFNLGGFNRGVLANYLNLKAVTRHYSSLSKDVFDQLGAGLALDEIGSNLYSDFKNGHFLNREAAITAYQDLLKKNAGETAFYMPNDYMFSFMSAYFDMPVTDNGYIYTSESVPFLQTVLAGYVPSYGPALNFSSDIQTDLLRLADYDVYPSFYLTHETTAKILDTSSNWIYTSSYGQWGTDVQQTYQWLNTLLGPVKGQAITNREELAPGVSATTYANGKMIIVNYNDVPFSAGGITVKARDAVITEVQP